MKSLSTCPAPQNCYEYGARIWKRLRRPGIDYEDSIQPDWESIPGLLKRHTNTGFVLVFLLFPILEEKCRSQMALGKLGMHTTVHVTRVPPTT